MFPSPNGGQICEIRNAQIQDRSRGDVPWLSAHLHAVRQAHCLPQRGAMRRDGSVLLQYCFAHNKRFIVATSKEMSTCYGDLSDVNRRTQWVQAHGMRKGFDLQISARRSQVSRRGEVFVPMVFSASRPDDHFRDDCPCTG